VKRGRCIKSTSGLKTRLFRRILGTMGDTMVGKVTMMLRESGTTRLVDFTWRNEE
jgi:hypothetical protein